MLRIQMDVHSEFDLLVAQRLAYALDHSSLTHKDPRLLQAANLLRGWNGDVSANSSAAAITAAAYHEIWPMLLAPQVRDYVNAHYHTQAQRPAARPHPQPLHLGRRPHRPRAAPPEHPRPLAPAGLRQLERPARHLRRTRPPLHQRPARSLHANLRLRTPHRHRAPPSSAATAPSAPC